MADALARAVSDLGYVSTARADPVTASLLVHMEPSCQAAAVAIEVESLVVGLSGDGPPSRPAERSPLRRVLSTALPDPARISGPVLLSAAGESLSLLQNLATFSVLNLVGGDSPAILRRLGFKTMRSQSTALAAASVGLAGASAVVKQHRARSWQRVSRQAEHRLRTELFWQVEQQDLYFFHHNGTGPVLMSLTREVDNVGSLIESGDALVKTLMIVALGGIALLRTSSGATVLIGTALPLVMIAARLLGPRTKAAFARSGPAAADLTKALENLLSGIVEVKSFCAEVAEARRVDSLSGQLSEVRQAASLASSLQSGVVEALLGASGSLGLTRVARQVMDGNVVPSRFVRTAFWVPTIMRAFGASAQLSRSYYTAKASAAGLLGVLEARPGVRSGDGRPAPGALAGDILIDRVSFGYESSKPVLKEVSLTIPAGSQVGIVGPNGSGKSTLLWLLLRFYDPDSGRIAIGGHDLRELDVADIRSAVAFVSQDVYLFDDTLEANLRYGRPDASSDQVAAAVDAAGVAGMLGELPDGLATRLGERGLRLSGGQRQRVALARALLKDAPILALDEATSHLDYEAEAALKTSLRAATSGRTVVLIAHRLSSIRDLDNIVVIDAGRVVEQGSHDDLVAHGGIYRRLWTLQRPQ